jgi:hypothetical protein
MEADMNVIRVGLRCLLAALAFAAIASTSASAASEYEVRNLPEIGKCTKVATGAGVYRGSACITVALPGKGKYEWTPVEPTSPQKFSGGGTEAVLSTAGHPTIKCPVANFSGEWINPKMATVSVELQACTNPLGEQCQTVTLNKSEIKTLPLLGELGFIKNEVKEGKVVVLVGLDLKPAPPLTELASYECTGTEGSAHVTGSVIAKIKPINKMTTESNLVYLVRKSGQQIPENFQGEPKDTLSTTFTNGITSTTAPSALALLTESGKNAVPLEIKAKEN